MKGSKLGTTPAGKVGAHNWEGAEKEAKEMLTDTESSS